MFYISKYGTVGTDNGPAVWPVKRYIREWASSTSVIRSRSCAAAPRCTRMSFAALSCCQGRGPHPSVTGHGQARELHRAAPDWWEARAELRFAARRSNEPSQARPEENELFAGSGRAWTELAYTFLSKLIAYTFYMTTLLKIKKSIIMKHYLWYLFSPSTTCLCSQAWSCHVIYLKSSWNLVAPFLSSLQEEISRLVLGFFLAYTTGTIHKKHINYQISWYAHINQQYSHQVFIMLYNLSTYKPAV
jgi:hypothetical protein